MSTLRSIASRPEGENIDQSAAGAILRSGAVMMILTTQSGRAFISIT